MAEQTAEQAAERGGRMHDNWYRIKAMEWFGKQRTADLTQAAAEVESDTDPKRGYGRSKPAVAAQIVAKDPSDKTETPPELEAKDGEILQPPISRGTNPGAWVQLWVWVPDPNPDINENPPKNIW